MKLNAKKGLALLYMGGRGKAAFYPRAATAVLYFSYAEL
jgi:hypothetical protein